MKLFIYDKDKHDERSRKLGIIPALLAVAGLGLTAMVTLGGFSASIENSDTIVDTVPPVTAIWPRLIV